MPEIPREMIEHKLGNDPAFKLIKQKETRYTPERHEAIRLEVNKLLKVWFIRPVDYPSWLANLVLVEKSNKSWRMCIDYTSLNKACPKDEYPSSVFARSWIPRRHVNFCHSRMPIWVITKSVSPLTTNKKTAFITSFGIFCYTKMVFGLKNVGATYQKICAHSPRRSDQAECRSLH
jgi:hypothetical protein